MAFPVLPRLDGASDGQLETAGPFGVVWLLFTEFYWFSFLGFMFLFFFWFSVLASQDRSSRRRVQFHANGKRDEI